tara:strand:+ start:60 stop:470 length:411 start_codon:yes stop_codon:yes gene_type:complete
VVGDKRIFTGAQTVVLLFDIQFALSSNPPEELVMMVAPGGFEPPSQDPESHMMDRYTKGLTSAGDGLCISIQPHRCEAIHTNLCMNQRETLATIRKAMNQPTANLPRTRLRPLTASSSSMCSTRGPMGSLRLMYSR